MPKLFAFFGKQRVEILRCDVVALQFGPGIGVRVGGVHPSDEVLGEAPIGLISAERLERAGQNHPSEVPQDGLNRVFAHRCRIWRPFAERGIGLPRSMAPWVVQ